MKYILLCIVCKASFHFVLSHYADYIRLTCHILLNKRFLSFKQSTRLEKEALNILIIKMIHYLDFFLEAN